MIARELQQRYGGEWESGTREVHGLVRRGDRSLKIELLQTSKWSCSVFAKGTCLASGSDPDALAAVANTLESIEF